ncbi:MAG: hypothetical protein MUF18_03805 [Fimbriiglobus sp.]|jgi:hypothetical protein|nr:hypothetical protein [Fimbriiglobus sp.]
MPSGFILHELRLSARFVRGYRYLDRAGEALVRLEDVLEKEWLPAEISPKSGTMRNDLLGMQLVFNSEGLNVTQEGVLSPPHFLDQACKILDVLASVLEVDTFIAPAVGVEYQKGFDAGQEEQAEAGLRNLGLVSVSERVAQIVGATPQALTYAMIHRAGDRWGEVRVENTRRLAVQVLRQARRESPDQRLLTRAKLLPEKQRDALTAVLAAKKMMPDVSPLAVQVELENRLEGEIARSDFPCFDFITESLAWAKDSIGRIAQHATPG